MPAAATRNTLSRQWELLKRLPSRGSGKTARELRQELADAGFQVSKRQVERDLTELAGVFAIDCNDQSIPYGWRWAAGASVDLPGLTVAEAVSLRLVEETVRPLLPASLLQALEPRFRQADSKIASLAGENAAIQWLGKVRTVPPTQPLLPPAIAPDVLAAVQEALMAGEQVDADYRAANTDSPTEMRLHPLALVNRGPVTYLVATAWDYADIRLYALQRITAARRRFEPCRRPADFDLDAYIESGALQFGNGRKIRLEAAISEDLGRILAETPLSADQVLTGGRLTATVKDTWQLRWWIMSLGDGIEVLGPAGLRQAIVDGVARTYSMYQSQ